MYAPLIFIPLGGPQAHEHSLQDVEDFSVTQGLQSRFAGLVPSSSSPAAFALF